MNFRTLNPESLPSPLDYLSGNGLIKKYPNGAWVLITCPVHKNGAEKTPSMSINVNDGHFKCHACGIKGGDVVALHRLRTGLGFNDAVAVLGGTFNV